ncbi:MAG TPA: IS1380 family transposase [Candidatus Limnocylindria bacterium]
MSGDSAILPVAFATTPCPLVAAFDGGRLTSDGGLPWLGEADDALGVCAAFASAIGEWRRGGVQHSLEALVRQRVFQIACGYADQDDADAPRRDPLLKLVCGRRPAGDPALASQPTFSRLENAVTRQGCYRLAVALVALYLRERGRAGRPARLVLDLDGSADPTHGRQEGAAYHAHYRQHMDHPLLIFDGATGQLITAIVRPGNVHASGGVVSALKRLLPALRERWPGIAIELRADGGFASPRLYTYCEEERLDYTIGLPSNARLARLAAPLLAEAQARQAASADPATATVRLAGSAAYRADSWERERRVVYKAEALPEGPNVRFVVTSRADAPLALYDWYVDRGEMEGWIKDLKNACRADRLSCHRFLANQCRLLLHAAAHWLLDTLRRWLAAAGLARTQLDTLRLALLKVGGRVLQHLDHVRLRLASGHPGQPLWAALAARSRPVNNPG